MFYLFSEQQTQLHTKLDIERKLNVYETFRRRPRRLRNSYVIVQFTYIIQRVTLAVLQNP